MMLRLLIFLAAAITLGLSGMPAALGQEPAERAVEQPAQAPAAGAKAGRLERAGEDAPGAKSPAVDTQRFGKVVDEAFGAYQRGQYLTALELARPRAEVGDAAAQTLIAEIYARGLGVRRDGKEAAKWYARAAEKGDPEAQMQYALMLIDGQFAEKDLERAFALMRSAAEAGKTQAQFNLAQMLTEHGSAQEAVAWYERAAQAGLPDAQYALAQVYASGIGGKTKDEAEARRWLLRAANQNFDTAQLDLGTWLVEGRGGERDARQGFAWLKRAAESGNVAAQNRIAKLYSAGIGTEPDPILAASWYILARRAGLTDLDMEDFLAGLTDEQIEQATERANRLR
ncbi:tetratricopeptide repeat protein [Chelativorans sp.]|uniref:tetratricopeptide repeat protein n=1 Tax=Chelativorans sp. TaxID=2203393 RepID=UPI002810D9E4|nr:tetratricopeptide repeat protein [Chelativorans sp.]